MDSWFYRIFGEEFGPISESMLLELRENGTLDASDDVRREGTDKWLPFERAFAASAPASAPVATAVADSDDSADDQAAWYCEVAGQELGPLSFRELMEMVERGMLGGEDRVRFQDRQYRPVGSIGRLVAVLPFHEHLTPQPVNRSIASTSTPSAPAKPVAAAPPAAAAIPAAAPPTAPSSPPPPPPPRLQYHPAAEEMNWYAWIRGVEYGPASLVQLSQWLQTGQLAVTDFVKYGQFAAWAPASPTVEQTIAGYIIRTPIASAPPMPVAPLIMQAPQLPAPAVSQPAAVAGPAAPAPAPAAPSVAPAATAATPKPAAAAPAERPSAAASTTGSSEKAATPREEAPKSTSASAGGWESSAASSSYSSASSASSYSSGGMGMASRAPMTPARKPASKGKSGAGIDFGALMSNPHTLKGLGAVAVVLAIVGFMYLPAGTGPEREKLTKLRDILTQFRQHRTDKIGPNEWSAFVESTNQQVQPMVDELKATASRKFPARQFLLWAARDRLPQVLTNAREKPTPQETELEYNLRKAASLLGMEADPDSSPPPAATATTASTTGS